MADEPHEVVKLLLARMESHPEEFRLKDPSYHDRWYNHMSAIHTHGNEVDKAALTAKVRDIRMAEVHEQVLDELCNGEERRCKEREDTEYERHLAQSMQHTRRQAVQNAVGQYQNALAGAYNGSITVAQPEPEPKLKPYDKIKKALGL